MQNINVQKKQKKLLLIGGAILIFTILLFLSIKKIRDSFLIETSFSFLPEDAVIYIDNNRIENNSKVLLEEGKHILKVQKTKFKTYEETITISKLKNNYYGILSPENEAYYEYGDEAIHKLLIKDSEEQEKLTEAYPILKYIPFNSDLPYSINYELSDDYLDLKIIIESQYDLSAGDIDIIRNILNNRLNEDSIDISDYNIIIKDYNTTFNLSASNNTNPVLFLEETLQNNNIKVQEGVQKDNYYYTNIKLCDTNSICDTYKTILKKKNNTWELIGQPEPFLTKYNTLNIPQDILREANNYS